MFLDDETLEPGSSGGPYLVNAGDDIKERWTVTGIVSSHKISCNPPRTIFTKLERFWCWIENCINKHICEHCQQANIFDFPYI